MLYILFMLYAGGGIVLLMRVAGSVGGVGRGVRSLCITFCVFTCNGSAYDCCSSSSGPSSTLLACCYGGSASSGSFNFPYRNPLFKFKQLSKFLHISMIRFALMHYCLAGSGSHSGSARAGGPWPSTWCICCLVAGDPGSGWLGRGSVCLCLVRLS